MSEQNQTYQNGEEFIAPEVADAETQDPGLRERAESLVGGAVDFAQLAYHGIVARIASIRERRAANVMERMDHKDALYTDIGARVLNSMDIQSPTATGDRARARTFFERFIDKRIDKRYENRAVVDTYKWRANKVFGPELSDSVRSRHDRRQHGEKVSSSKKEKHRDKRAISKQVKRAELGAYESRLAETDVRAERLKHGEIFHKRTGHEQRAAVKSLGRAASIPISRPVERWREERKQRAIGRIKQNHRRREQQLDTMDEIIDRNEG